MTSYTTLVNVDLEIAYKVSSFLAQLMASESEEYLAECKKIIDAKNTSALINKFLEKKDLIFAMEKEVDIEGTFQAIFSVIHTLHDESKETNDIIQSILSAVVSDKENKPRVRLNVLLILFNLCFSGELKCEVLNAIFEYTKATQQTKHVTHFYARLNEWMDSWSISVEKQRTLLQNVFHVLVAENEHSVALSALIHFFKTYQGAGAYPAEVESLVTSAVLSAIKSPADSFADRTSLLEAISTQSISATLKPLVELLKIICDGSLTDYITFRDANAALFPTYQLDEADLEHEIKLLTLCSLAAQAVDKTVTFAAVRTVLQLAPVTATTESDGNDYEVEMWVIEAISERLLEASIDQLSSTITINRYAHRSFGAAHWQAVQQKLRQLRQNLANVVDTIVHNKTVTATAATSS